jgi:hypothetical protein
LACRSCLGSCRAPRAYPAARSGSSRRSAPAGCSPTRLLEACAIVALDEPAALIAKTLAPAITSARAVRRRRIDASPLR